MKYLLLPDNFKGEKIFTLKGDDFSYLTRVLRYRKGNTLEALDKRGNIFILKIIEITRDSLLLETTKKEHTVQSLNHPVIYLYQCLPKGKKMDTIVRQATEMGVYEITPVLSRYSIPILRNRIEKEKRNKRWKSIIKEAVQQSGNRTPPRITELIEFKNLMEKLSQKLNMEISPLIIFHPDNKNRNSLYQYLSGDISEIHILIGPEGGFAQDELELAEKIGAVQIALGETILRTETASIYAVAAIKTILKEKNNWTINSNNEKIVSKIGRKFI